MHVHIWLLWCNMLFVVYNCPGQQDPQISCQLNTYVTWWSRNLFFLQSLPQALSNCNNRYKMPGTIYRRLMFGTFMTVCMPIAAQRGYTVYWCDCLGTPYCDVCFIWSEFVIIYSYNDKLPVTSIFNTMNLSLKVLNFFFPVMYFDKACWSEMIDSNKDIVKWISDKSLVTQTLTLC